MISDGVGPEGDERSIGGFAPPSGLPAATLPPPPPPPPPAPSPPPAGPARGDHRVLRRWIGAGVGLVVVFAAIVVVNVATHHGPDTPKEWDPRVSDLVSFVEDERGLLFDHPVPIDFLTAEQYSEVVGEKSRLTDDDKKQIEAAESELRAVGLVNGDVDLAGSMGTLQDSGTLAFYDFDTQRVVVRGTELTPGLRVTLVHELTHALQDQHFDLGRLASLESDAETGLRALVEGDATRIEDRYIDKMTTADRKAYDSEAAQQGDDADLSSVPPVLLAYFGAPYTLGAELVDLIDASGGNKAVNAAFDHPPDSEAELLDPFRFLASDTSTDVPTPALKSGEQRIDDGDMGALALYMLLATQLDPHDALAGADAWDGDEYVAFDRDGRTCIRVAISSTDASGADTLETLLQRWADGAPEIAAVVTRHGALLSFESCDPGSKAATLDFNRRALALPLVRSEIGVSIVKGGVPADAADCIASKIVGAYSVDDLTAEDQSQFETQAFIDQVRGFAQQCKGG